MKKKASEYLEMERASDFSQLMRRVLEHNETAKALDPFLTPEMEKCCIFSSIRENTIIFLVPFSTATAIGIVHYQIPDVLSRLKQTKEFKHIEKIQCKIVHDFKNRFERSPSSHSAIPISHENSKIIQQHAEYIQDEELRESLFRISRHTEK